ncbi:MAG: DUF4364 family protein [Defluviitaleaceae bacterium]|nr:DUF4364 family protein [Defluviitaleaceae bacterium]MCL2199285.1 DUF4364 family protein [Defluviitaleaceae bacterium]
MALEYKDVENKLLLLYLINMMELPMTRSQVTDFVIQNDLMNHFTLGENLADMVERGYLEATQENTSDENITRYVVTDEGLTNLELLESQIPRHIRNIITQYVEENRGKIKKGYEKTAHYFPAENGEYIVKCGIYDDKRDTMLMELSFPVVTREQAKQMQQNWNTNYTTLYQKILLTLTETI